MTDSAPSPAGLRIALLECLSIGTQCSNCGRDAWIVDGHPPERTAWLLCMDLSDQGCVETVPLPEGTVIIDYEGK